MSSPDQLGSPLGSKKAEGTLWSGRKCIDGDFGTESCNPVNSVRGTHRLLTINGFLNGLRVFILLDSGSTGNFVSEEFCRLKGLNIKDCGRNGPPDVRLANGYVQSVFCLDKSVSLVLGSFVCSVKPQVTSLQAYDVILGQPWLEKWEPRVCWKEKKVLIGTVSIQCGQMPIKFGDLNSLMSIDGVMKVKRLSRDAIMPFKGTKGAAGYDLSSAEACTVPSGGKLLVSTDLALEIPGGYYGRLAPRSGLASKHFIDVGAGVIDSDYRGPVKVLLFNFGDENFEVKQGDRIAQLIVTALGPSKVQEVKELTGTERENKGFGSTGVGNKVLSVVSTVLSVKPCVELPDDLEKLALEMEATGKENELRKVLFEFKDVFPKELKGLPPRRGIYDHEIRLEYGAKPISLPSYRYTPEDYKEMKKQIKELSEAGMIERSVSAYAAPLVFVSKKDGTRRMAVDYRKINAQTIPNKYPIPHHDDLFDQLKNAMWFSKVDLRSGYHQLRIKEGDEEKTAFRCKFGHYQYKVMPFGLINAPSSFMELMHKVLEDEIDFCVQVFLDDILIYSATEDDHIRDLGKVLGKLRKWNLKGKASKCEFFKKKVEFLGHGLSNGGVEVLHDKVKTVQNWEKPCTVRDVRAFLGLTGYYRRFIQGYSQVAMPLTELTKQDVEWKWCAKEEKAFQVLKEKLTNAPILKLPDTTRDFRVETDASGTACGMVLSQEHGGKYHPIAFGSCKFNRHEKNYPVWEQEMLAIIKAMKLWRTYLVNGKTHEVITDHKGLETFLTRKEVTGRHARWLALLTDYRLKITYRPGRVNDAADALSRKATDSMEEGPSDEGIADEITAISVLNGMEEKWKNEIRSAMGNDDIVKSIKLQLSKGNFTEDWKEDQGLLFKRKGKEEHEPRVWRVYVPNSAGIELKKKIIETIHSREHWGMWKTLNNVERRFVWDRMKVDIRKFVHECPSCAAQKRERKRSGGLLKPLEIPSRLWDTITMDFAMGLPDAEGYNGVLVVVEKISKLVKLIAVNDTITAEETAKEVWDKIVRNHGVPLNIVSDRDPRFTSRYWQEFWKKLGVNLAMSSSQHPETDGQSERCIQTVEQLMRFACGNEPTSWKNHLGDIEFSINDAVQESTGKTPFEVNYGYHPSSMLDSTLGAPEGKVQSITEWHEHLKRVLEQVKLKLEKAQARQKTAADNRRRRLEIEVGDKVWVRAEALRIGGCTKLRQRFIGPFEVVLKYSGVSYKIKLPEQYSKIYPVFHVSCLKLWNSGEQEVPFRPPPMDIEDNVFEVERIISERWNSKKKRKEFLVRWTGYDRSEDTWEPLSNLGSCDDVLRQWNNRVDK